MEKYGKQYKDMKKREKVHHIWEYYRWHILGTIIAIFFIGSLGKAMFFPEPPDAVDITIAGQMYTNMDLNKVTEAFKEDYDTGLDLTNVNWEDAQTAMVMLQKMPLMITADEMDIVAVSSAQYIKFVEGYGTDMFTPLETVEGLKPLLEKYKDQLVSIDYILDEDGNKMPSEEHIFGIRVQKLSNIPCIEANEEFIIGLTSKVKDLDKTITMLEYILE